MNYRLHAVLPALLLLASAAVSRAAEPTTKPVADPSRYFAIEVVDEQTGRGVPLVELKTVAAARYYTDSAGLIAFEDPALAGRTVFFHVSSHGYEFPKDGFGQRGVRLDVKPGGSAKIKLKRLNIAERLYRITGEGIYRDSVLLGRPVPIKHPLLNAQVSGQDSAQQVLYHGKIFWLFGDTMRPSYPLGHFWMAGASSELPTSGGLDPSVGIDLTYLVDKEGFSRGTYPKDDRGPAWLDAMAVLKDDAGKDRIVARAQVMKDLSKRVANQLVVWNDEKQLFDVLRELPLDREVFPIGHPIRHEEAGVAYLYYGDCQPNLRTRADWKSFQDLDSYESFTPIAPGEKYAGANSKLDRDASGKLVWAWKKNTGRLLAPELAALVKAGKLKQEEAYFLPLDVDTQKPVTLAMGLASYNDYRKKWVLIAGRIDGDKSQLGEIYYAEADAPEGPWPRAKKIITHDKYSFYNPVQHPFFEQDGGRVIYFQGTYTGTFSRESDFTPGYEYNQIMYRLDLSDPRLAAQ